MAIKKYVIKTNYGYYEDFDYVDDMWLHKHGIKPKIYKSSTDLGGTLLVGDVIPKFTQDISKAFSSIFYFGSQIENILRWANKNNKKLTICLEEYKN